MRRLFTISALLATVLMMAWGLSRPWRERRQRERIFSLSSDAGNIRRTIRIVGDDWLGYLVLRSVEFQRVLAESGIRPKFDMEPDFNQRLAALEDGSAQFAAITLDSYLTNGAANGWPGAAIFVIDESFGGDAIIGSRELANVDALNSSRVRGAFVGNSPSEFLLRAETTHFRLERLRPRIAQMRVGTIDQAYSKLARGEADFAVLWEPQTSRALSEIPGAHRLIDTQHAQGIIIDLCLASRNVVANEPELAETVTRAYFHALHQLINDPRAFREAAARDAGQSPEVAGTMLAGIKFAALEDNAESWLAQRKGAAAQLDVAFDSIGKILRDHNVAVSLPSDDLLSVIYRPLVNRVASKRGDIPALNARRTADSGFYRPLTDAEWDALSRKVRGTLLDQPITFRPGSTEIPEDFQDELRDAVPKLRHYPTYRILVEAHVSTSGDTEADQLLSEERALAVKRFLMWECGVADERVRSIGKGATEPVVRVPGESGTAFDRRNRRARLVLVGE
jgi:outer membrane protein OmpA-like peptidoglycan-associated protein